MHLGIDVREACRSIRTGKARWLEGFVDELLLRDVALTLLSDAPLPEKWQKRLHAPHAPGRNAIVFPRSGMTWHWAAARFVRADSDIDLYISPTSYVVPRLLGSSFPCIPVMHDLVAFRRERHDRKARVIERLTLGKVVQSAAHLCTVSQTTKIDLLARFPGLDPARVTPIFAGPSFEDTDRNVSDRTTILCIGTLSPRKNQRRLIEAYASLPVHLGARHRLVLVGGRGWKDRPVLAAVRDTEGVEWRDYTSDDVCRSLLCTATVFALPSLYEGFGMPVLDALSRGLPVLTADRGSLKEVAGSAALLVDPEDVPSIAKGLQRLLEDEALRARLIREGFDQAQRFTWPKTVDLFLAAVAGLPGACHHSSLCLPPLQLHS